MNSFSYTRATGVEDAVSHINDRDKTKYIAGGTNLLDLMKEDVMRPDSLVDITRLPLSAITGLDDGGLRLGALVTNADTSYNEQVLHRYPLLSKAILAGASPQLRNMATDGGNLMQRTRCYYFYDVATPCNKREPGSGCSAINGINRIHAILGASDNCIAVHPSDMCVALAALEAEVHVTGSQGERVIPFEEFHRLPGLTPQLDNTLAADELITAIHLPAKGFAANHAYLKLRDRASYAFALVSVAAALDIEGGVIKEARLALGGVAHKPWRNREAEQMLHGQPPTTENFKKVAEAVLTGAKGYRYNNFKIELAKRAIIRAFTQAVNMEGAKA